MLYQIIIQKSNFMKITITTILFFFALTSFSQTNKSLTVTKIKKFLDQYSVMPGTSNTGKNTVVYYNKVDKILDIDNIKIPLLEVKITYFFVKNSEDHCVSFECKESTECIVGQDEETILGFMAPFKTKKQCYDFISLIDELKR